MTDEEAIKMLRREIECLSHTKCQDCILEKVCDLMQEPTDDKYIEAYEMAIKALEQAPCEDAISRAEAIKALECEISGKIKSDIDLSEHTREFQEFANMIINAQKKAIQALPSVTPQPKTGHWIGIDEEPHEVWECDHCGFVIDGSGCIDPYDYRDTYKYCPNCGCRMVEPQERSDKK